jgi:hypothetical protein
MEAYLKGSLYQIRNTDFSNSIERAQSHTSYLKIPASAHNKNPKITSRRFKP